MNEQLKVCTGCNKEKAVSEFHKYEKTRCVECVKAYLKKYRKRTYVKHKERLRQTSEEYKQKRNARLQAQRKARQ